MYNVVPLPRSQKAPSPVSLLTSRTENANHAPGVGLDHDSFMTNYKWFNPDIVDALDMNNGLVSPSFGPQCIGHPHPGSYSAGFGRFSLWYAGVQS